jgi:GNAT superfamily N-acetyltransferase
MTVEQPDPTRVHALEHCEIEAWGDWYRCASAASIAAFGIGIQEVPGGILTRAGADVLALNRVIGLGLAGPVEGPEIDRIVDAYATAGIPRFFVQVPPTAPASLFVQLEERGFRHYNNWIKLVRDGSDPPEARTELEVRPARDSDASEFGRITSSCFDWPSAVGEWVGDAVGRPGWRHYVAFEGSAAHRGKGAQSALLARRIRDAVDAGCDTLVVETAEQTAEKGSPSWRNTLAFGFRQAYVRANYIKEF